MTFRPMSDDRPVGAESGGLARLGRQVPILWLLIVAVLTWLGVQSLSVWSLSSEFYDVRAAESDNTTWLVAQVEVEALKFGTLVDQALIDQGGQVDLAPVRRAFDIMISRVEVVDAYLSQPGMLHVLKSDRDWPRILAATDTLRRQIDVSDTQLMANLPAIRETLQSARSPIRNFALDALRTLVSARTENRRATGAVLARSSLISLSLVLFLLAISAATWWLTRQVQSRGLQAERAKSNLERTQAASLDAVIVVGGDGRIRQANPAAEVMYGLSRAELVGADFARLVLPETVADPETAQLRQVLVAGQSAQVPQGRLELTSARRNGDHFPVELSLAGDRDADGAPILIAFLRDISDRIEAERSLHEARDAALKAAEAKTRFLAVMSHEMRTPLNGVSAALELLRETTRLSRKQARYLGIAEGAASHALSQINDVLELTRLESGDPVETPSAFNLTQVIGDLTRQLTPLAEKQGNRITLDLPELRQAEVLGPRRVFQRTLMNLLGNALKFTSNGEVLVSASIKPVQGGLQLCVRVRDTGIGIPADRLETIFDPFETVDNGYDRAAEGSGLGLGIARRAVEHMGGKIGVESTPGAGSTFWFTALMQPGTTVPATVSPPAAPLAAVAPHVVLLAEDNAVNRLVLREMLVHLGQEVVEATTGAEAVAQAQTRRFDLILMDISMPGMDGLTATAKIRGGQGPNCNGRIIGLTAHFDPDELARFRAAGMDQVLQKPMTFPLLMRLLSDIGCDGSSPDTAGGSEMDVAVLADLCQILPIEARAAALTGFLDEGDALLALLADPTSSAGDVATAVHRHAGACGLMGARSFGARLCNLQRKLEVTPSWHPGADELQTLAAEWAFLRQELPRHLGIGPNPKS